MTTTRKRKRSAYVKKRKVAANVLVPSLSRRLWGKERIFRFKRREHTSLALVMNGTAQNTYLGKNFQLDQTEQYTELTGLFDQYRIVGIRVQIFPRFNQFDIQGATSTFTHVPQLIIAVDVDDAATPTDYRDVLTKDNAKVYDPYVPIDFTFKPKIAMSAYGSAGFGQYAVGEGAQWVNSASDDVEYYGLKITFLPYSASNNDSNPPYWDIVYTYFIECRYAQ